MTWNDVLQAIDQVIEELAYLMDTDPQHGVLYQQRMAVMLWQRQEVACKIVEVKSDVPN